MSAREQARRDAEFDRLLAKCDGVAEVAPVREAYEMGKRHESENAPAWHDAPTCPGLWVARRTGFHIVEVADPSNVRIAAWADYRWYGPIPADEVKP